MSRPRPERSSATEPSRLTADAIAIDRRRQESRSRPALRERVRRDVLRYRRALAHRGDQGGDQGVQGRGRGFRRRGRRGLAGRRDQGDHIQSAAGVRRGVRAADRDPHDAERCGIHGAWVSSPYMRDSGGVHDAATDEVGVLDRSGIHE